ncbi:hypothetical protein V1515DRAFT_607361 [Lipomyces mesembrius]
MDAGTNNFLTKPINREQLHQISDEYCELAVRQDSSSRIPVHILASRFLFSIVV